MTTEFVERKMFDFEDFLRDTSKNVALAVANHARIVHKDNDARVITVYDPWKQRVVIESQRWLTSAARRRASRSSSRRARRTRAPRGRASCRRRCACWHGKHGKDAIMAKINTEENRHLLIFPVITQLLYTKCRKRCR